MSDDEPTVRSWLDSGDPVKVRHAALRIAKADADGFWKRPRIKPAKVDRPARPAVMTDDRPACDYRERCGCQTPLCLHLENGAKFGVADGVEYRVSAESCRACGGVLRTPSLPVLSCAVVIPCRNYGRYLAEALESVLGQSRPPSEVLIVDDGSTDDTHAVAASFAGRGVKYLRIDAGSVWEARKAGFRATAGDVVCFLDADDVLPPDYLASGLAMFGRQTGFVYSDYQEFGDETGRTNFPDFNRGLLDCENYCHAGSLVRRRAVEIARVFDRPRPLNAYADWFLWRLLVDSGFTGAKSPAVYRYRRHADSMIRASQAAGTTYPERASLAHQEVTIVCPLSGRDWAWPRYREWLESQTWPRSQCRLLVLDTGPTAGVREWLARCDYPDARYVRLDVGRKGLASMDRTANTAEVRLAMSRIYSRAMAAVETPFVFVLEDDVVPPDDVIGRLAGSMEEKVAAVSGVYTSRFSPQVVAWSGWTPTALLPIQRDDRDVQDVGGFGFGCVLIRRCVLIGEMFASLPGESADYDVCFFQRLRADGWRVLLDWTCEADHRSPPASPRFPPEITDMGRGVFVSGWQSCDSHGREFPLHVHIYKQSNLDAGVVCGATERGKGESANGIVVEYAEGESLSTLSTPIGELAAYCSRPGEILIHCGVGQCRSPTLAVVALIARGSDPWDAIREVFRRTWEGRGWSPAIFDRTVNEILAWSKT